MKISKHYEVTYTNGSYSATLLNHMNEKGFEILGRSTVPIRVQATPLP